MLYKCTIECTTQIPSLHKISHGYICVVSNVVIGFEQQSLQLTESMTSAEVIVTTVVPTDSFPFLIQIGQFSVSVEINDARSTAKLGTPHHQY